MAGWTGDPSWIFCWNTDGCLMGTKFLKISLDTDGEDGVSFLRLSAPELLGASLRRAGWKALTGSSCSIWMTVEGVGLLSAPKNVKLGLVVSSSMVSSWVVGTGVVVTVVLGAEVTGLLLTPDSLGWNLTGSLRGNLTPLTLSLTGSSSSTSLVTTDSTG